MTLVEFRTFSSFGDFKSFPEISLLDSEELETLVSGSWSVFDWPAEEPKSEIYFWSEIYERGNYLNTSQFVSWEVFFPFLGLRKSK